MKNITPSTNGGTPERVFILPGESAFSRQPAVIGTLLGSCVAVCLYDESKRWGGMNHYLLPKKAEGSLPPGKYGDTSIEALLHVVKAAGSNVPNLVASIYGGGNVIGHLGSAATTGAANVGERNIAIAREKLLEHRIKIARQDVGGSRGRKIYMDTVTNEINVRFIETSDENKARAQRMEKLGTQGVRVLVVDDSSTVRKLIGAGIEAEDGIDVVGEAENPYEAREKILELDPDVLCLDIIMPRMDGLSFLKKIMQYKPIPTVIVSTIAKRGSEMRDNVLKAGAVDVIDKEELEIYKNRDAVRQVLVPTLKQAAQTIVRKRSS